MDDQIRAQLTQAYQFIRSGNKKAALDLLRPICQSHPENVDAWWLLANALSDPAQARSALQKVLLLDPFHEQAQQKFDKLNTLTTASVPAIKVTGTLPKQQRTGRGGFLLVVLIALLIIAGLVGGFVALSGKDKSSQDSTVQIVLPTAITPPLKTEVADVNTPLPPTITLTVTPARTLPPTWTSVPTVTLNPILPTFTPWVEPTRVLATADPADFGDTYWQGNGDGFTLESYTRSGGRHLRFYEFPVKVFVDGAFNSTWQGAIQNMINEINPIVPIELVDEEPLASLAIFILDPNEYERWSGCPQSETVGCAGIVDLGDFGGGDTFHRIHAEVWISTDSKYPYWSVLHEVVHGLGVMVHSPNESDIMTTTESDLRYLSQRDRNTLRWLYANPSYAD